MTESLLRKNCRIISHRKNTSISSSNGVHLPKPLYYHLFALPFKAGVPNLSLAMYPFSFLTDEDVPLQHFNR